MARADLFRRLKENILSWVALSVAAHMALLAWAHPFASATPTPKPAITVQLVTPPPKPPEPEPEPLKPEPPQPDKPQPQKPKPVQAKTLDTTPPPREETPPPNVVAVAPKPEEQAPPPDTFKVPPPDPKPEPPKPEPSDADIKAYGKALSQEIGKYKSYPRIAQMRGWEDLIILLLDIDGSGKVISVRIEKSGDHEVLTTEAQEMVKRMLQPPPIPEGLRGHTFVARVPVNFRLEK
ncbi:MAG: energy transducer TonB [Methylobacillus sp.]|jgi:protein TonB|nr:energy transducer TonB [Methylobacillus sp.]